jgi:hypothetical protein
MVKGGYYVKENDTHGYSELCLLPEAAALAPEGLLQTPNSIIAWKAIIRQLEDQLMEGATEPGVIAAQVTGLAEFALRVQQTPYATMPMRARCRAHSKEGDETASKGDEGTLEILQRLEDSIVSLRREIGVWAPAARYITLHGGVGELGGVVNALQQEVSGVAQGVSAASAQAVNAWDKACLVQGAMTALSGDASRAFSHLRAELADVKSEREVLESTVVTSLMEQAALGSSSGVTQLSLDKQFRLYNKAVNSRLDMIRQEMKGGGYHCRQSQVLRAGGSHGLGPNPPPLEHLPVYWGNDLCHVPDLRGRGPSRRYDEAGGARQACQAHLHAVGAGALGPHILPSGLGRSQGSPTRWLGGLWGAQELQTMEAR